MRRNESTQPRGPACLRPPRSAAEQSPRRCCEVEDSSSTSRSAQGSSSSARSAVQRGRRRVALDRARARRSALVGESGCGKSTTGRAILRLHEPTSGAVAFDGRTSPRCRTRSCGTPRARCRSSSRIRMPRSIPRMTVATIIAEPLHVHGWQPARPRRVAELLELVGLTREHADRYPHEFSGGQRQRIGIARALALDPQLVVLDEPVSALDVSIQAQVLNLLQRAPGRLRAGLPVHRARPRGGRHICDRVAVMYLGTIVETGTGTTFFEQPLHPYTQALLSAVPIPDPGWAAGADRAQGDVPSPAHPPIGLPVPHPLLAAPGARRRRPAPVHRGVPAAGPGGRRAGSTGRRATSRGSARCCRVRGLADE